MNTSIRTYSRICIVWSLVSYLACSCTSFYKVKVAPGESLAKKIKIGKVYRIYYNEKAYNKIRVTGVTDENVIGTVYAFKSNEKFQNQKCEMTVIHHVSKSKVNPFTTFALVTVVPIVALGIAVEPLGRIMHTK